MIRPLASSGGCQLIRMARGRPSRPITVKSFGAELGADQWKERAIVLHSAHVRLRHSYLIPVTLLYDAQR